MMLRCCKRERLRLSVAGAYRCEASDAPDMVTERPDYQRALDKSQEKMKPSADPTTIAVRISGSAISRQLLRKILSIALFLRRAGCSASCGGSPGQRGARSLIRRPGSPPNALQDRAEATGSRPLGHQMV